MRYLLALLFCLCVLFNKSYGQTCTGSLGDPIINIDFGAGPTLLSPNTYSQVTNYKYTTTQVEDGEYTIKNSLVGDHPTGWWQRGDHTTIDGSGYMMVVNASKDPGEFYRATITGLCPGTTYEFAAWVLNLLVSSDGIKPNISFTIQTSDGAVFTKETGDLKNSDSEWHQHGTFFMTPAGSGTVTIIMRNKASGGAGNDIAIDDITFRACGSVISSRFEAAPGATVTDCSGKTVSYNMVCTAGAGYTDPAFQWQQNTSGVWEDIPGANATSYQAVISSAAAGDYNFRMAIAERASIASAYCRIYSNILTIRVNQSPDNVTVTPDASICIGDALQLAASGGDTYAWTPNTSLSDANIANPIASPTNDTRYVVQINNANGCYITRPVLVTVTQRPAAYAGKDVKIHRGQSVTLNGLATGKTHYWTPSTGLSSDTALNVVIWPAQDITYTLHSITGAPCNFEATDDVFIRVYDKVVIPNTFTPNNDGVNDYWNIEALGTYPAADTQVFNRQGIRIFQAKGYDKPWDGTFAGKPLPAAAYYYKIDLKDGQVFSGWVMIIR